MYVVTIYHYIAANKVLLNKNYSPIKVVTKNFYQFIFLSRNISQFTFLSRNISQE